VTRNVSRKRTTIEYLACDCLDVRNLQRRGAFDDGWATFGPSLRWPKIASMSVARYLILLKLHGRTMPQLIRVSWTKVHFGGERPWVHCSHCEKRSATLYRGLSGYYCRHCVADRLAYASQRLSAQARPHFQACKLRLRLGGDAHLTATFPERPFGMHRRTYGRLRRRGIELEAGLSKRLRTMEPDYARLCAYLD
jgi:hypothetical protein